MQPQLNYFQKSKGKLTKARDKRGNLTNYLEEHWKTYYTIFLNIPVSFVSANFCHIADSHYILL
jgi:hypothetical protein